MTLQFKIALMFAFPAGRRAFCYKIKWLARGCRLARGLAWNSYISACFGEKLLLTEDSIKTVLF